MDDLSDALEQIFWLGARTLEILIMIRLYQKIKAQLQMERPKLVCSTINFQSIYGIIEVILF